MRPRGPWQQVATFPPGPGVHRSMGERWPSSPHSPPRSLSRIWEELLPSETMRFWQESLPFQHNSSVIYGQ